MRNLIKIIAIYTIEFSQNAMQLFAFRSEQIAWFFFEIQKLRNVVAIYFLKH